MADNPFVFTRANCEVVSEFARTNSALKLTMDRQTHWNKMTIKQGARMDKDTVLSTLVNAIAPHEIFPVFYQIEDNDSFFLFRHGFSAVILLLERKMCIADPETHENIELIITAQYKTFNELPYDPVEEIEKVIRRRIVNEKTIDLRNLKEEPEMQHIFCSFLVTKFASIVFDSIFKHIKVENLMLSHNGITNLRFLERLAKSSLKVLDLRHNMLKIRDFGTVPRNLNVEHLLLAGNPMVSEYESTQRFIDIMTKRVPTLKKIDFIPVRSFVQRISDIPIFLYDPSYESFVDHFLFHYHGLYKRDRKSLAIMYHDNATFTICSMLKPVHVIPPHTSSFSTELKKLDHNLFKNTDMIKKYNNVFHGRERIKQALHFAPDVDFGYSTFCVDVPSINSQSATICCSGILQPTKMSLGKQNRFSRVWVLIPSKTVPGEWKISNDMWTIGESYAASEPMDPGLNPKIIEGDFAPMINPQLKDRTYLTNLVQKLTKMKAEWVERFLEEADWDLEFTLQSFTDQFKADVIPVDAFEIPANKAEMLEPLIKALVQKQVHLLGSGVV
ncbi:Nuclear RNA export factor [Nesidiocoris tenuis]|uniref:Nuclear RNA export factor n=1 Tax=Nesidiocoris tenuis TaxID=355587 RepID=A0ABN7B5Q5_9HEMI|nr:Nuclear RNA export factor [Nesidiocoris tenuis]